MSADGPQTVWGFPATSWSLVRRVRGVDERAAGAALDALCRAYWRPLYAYARGGGLARADAQDAVQEFFATALRRELFQRAEEAQGKLRSFLLTAFKRVLMDRAAQAAAARRKPEGGWAEGDFEAAEAEWARTAGGGGIGAGPEAGFERQWARELLAQALARTEARYAKEGKAAVFAALKGDALEEGVSERESDRGQGDRRRKDQEAEALSAGARRVAVHRLRKRFGEALRAVVAETLPEGGDVEAELRELGAVLRGGGA
jgi:DNA-directed RNA polymerase specialized sigma24 family protein